LSAGGEFERGNNFRAIRIFGGSISDILDKSFDVHNVNGSEYWVSKVSSAE
jgi:hypothetical protein